MLEELVTSVLSEVVVAAVPNEPGGLDLLQG